MLAQWDRNPNALTLRQFESPARDSQVFQSQSMRFEQRDLLRRSAAGRNACDDITERVHRFPVETGLRFGCEQISAFDSRDSRIVHDDAIRALHGSRIDFLLLGEIRTDGVDMDTGPQPATVEQ